MARQRKKHSRPDDLDELRDEREEDMDDLNFDNDQPEPPPQKGPDPDEEVRDAGLTGAAMPGNDASTDDDMTPETLFHEDGIRWPNEPHDNFPPEEQSREVGVDEIGAGRGLDEAELGRVQPLDKKPWDGNPADALGSGPDSSPHTLENLPSGDPEPEQWLEEHED